MRDREKEKRRRKGRKSIGEKRMKGLCWEKKRKKKEEINFAMLVVASNSRERCKKEYLPCAISFPAHSVIM